MNHAKQIAGLIVLLIIGQNLMAEEILRSTGLFIRGSYFAPQGDHVRVAVYNHWMDNDVNLGHFGGSLLFFSRLSPQSFLECSIGSMAEIETQTEWFGNEETNVSMLTPFLVGVRYNLISPYNRSHIEPYITAGAGPYWQHDVHVVNKFMDESSTTVKSKAYSGGYLGGGIFIPVIGKFAFNADMRYHFVKFEPGHEFSGFEFSSGIGFTWGTW